MDSPLRTAHSEVVHGFQQRSSPHREWRFHVAGPISKSGELRGSVRGRGFSDVRRVAVVGRL